jgi:hypothetical protein
MLCKGEDFTDMENFGNEREQWLRKFLELPNGVPDSDTFRRVFERIDLAELAAALYDRLGAEREKRGVVAIDGKTICGSANADHKKRCKLDAEGGGQLPIKKSAGGTVCLQRNWNG